MLMDIIMEYNVVLQPERTKNINTNKIKDPRRNVAYKINKKKPPIPASAKGLYYVTEYLAVFYQIVRTYNLFTRQPLVCGMRCMG